MKCQECRFLMCSEDCAGSENHKEECRFLQRLPDMDHDSQIAVLAVVRTLIIRKHGGEPWDNIGEVVKLNASVLNSSPSPNFAFSLYLLSFFEFSFLQQS